MLLVGCVHRHLFQPVHVAMVQGAVVVVVVVVASVGGVVATAGRGRRQRPGGDSQGVGGIIRSVRRSLGVVVERDLRNYRVKVEWCVSSGLVGRFNRVAECDDTGKRSATRERARITKQPRRSTGRGREVGVWVGVGWRWGWIPVGPLSLLQRGCGGVGTILVIVIVIVIVLLIIVVLGEREDREEGGRCGRGEGRGERKKREED